MSQRYALIRPDNTIDRMQHNIDPNVATKAGWRWLPAAPGVPPAHDPEIEIVEGPTRTVGATEVTEAYSKRNLTAAELDQRKDVKISQVDKMLGAALFQVVNEVRALKVPAEPALTKAQFMAWLKSKIGTF